MRSIVYGALTVMGILLFHYNSILPKRLLMCAQKRTQLSEIFRMASRAATVLWTNRFNTTHSPSLGAGGAGPPQRAGYYSNGAPLHCLCWAFSLIPKVTVCTAGRSEFSLSCFFFEPSALPLSWASLPNTNALKFSLTAGEKATGRLSVLPDLPAFPSVSIPEISGPPSSYATMAHKSSNAAFQLL